MQMIEMLLNKKVTLAHLPAALLTPIPQKQLLSINFNLYSSEC